MKSAYELAMERLGGEKTYSVEQKKQFAEIDGKYEAKRVEAKFAADKQLAEAGADPARQDEIREELARELRRLDEKREAEKDRIRQET